MEPPERSPYISPALALELLRTPPAPIPQGDPMLCGRSALLELRRRAAATAATAAIAATAATAAAAAPSPPAPSSASASPRTPPGTSAVAAAATPPLPLQQPQHPVEAGAAPVPAGDSAAAAAAAAAAVASSGGSDGGGDGAASCYRQLPSHDASELSYDDFVRLYMAPNKPVVIRGATAGWRAAREWRCPASGRLRLGALGALAGGCRVCVTDTTTQDDGCGDVRTVSLAEFLDWWRNRPVAAGCGGGGGGGGCSRGAQGAPDWGPAAGQPDNPSPGPEWGPPGLKDTGPGAEPDPEPDATEAAAQQAPHHRQQQTQGGSSAPVSALVAQQQQHLPAAAPLRAPADVVRRGERKGEEEGPCGGPRAPAGGLADTAAAARAGAGAGSAPPACQANGIGAAGLDRHEQDGACGCGAAAAVEAAEAAAGAAGCCSSPLPAEGLWYLKDWHFVAEFPDYGAYRLPVFFADDWLNAYYDASARPAAAAPTPSTSAATTTAPATAPPAAAVSAPPAAVHVDPAPQADSATHQSSTPTPTTPTPTGSGAQSLPGAPEPKPPVVTGAPAPPAPAAAAAAATRPGSTELPDAGQDAAGQGSKSGSLSSSPAAAAATAAAAAASTSDYRFCYLGPAGTWTALHSDVLRSHSWSANVCGAKRWLMLHPDHTHMLYDRAGLRTAPHLELGLGAGTGTGAAAAAAAGGCDAGDFPWLEEARSHAYEFVQESGDAVFVPSGWHHCVENLEDTLSLNHNWLNAHNAHWAWALLRRQHEDAAAAIEDCRQLCPVDEFESLVQSNLAANMGLDWRRFVELIQVAVREALASVRAAGGAPAARHGGSGSGSGSTCDGGGSAAGGLTLEAAEAAGPQAMTGLLTLQRAGSIMRNVVASFEELVMAPARRQLLRGRSAGDGDALSRLSSTQYIAQAQDLLSTIEKELGAHGVSLRMRGR